MKLSMWMIANRLAPLLDIETEIREDARPILNSARTAYATNCVHVYRDKDAIIYDGEGDRIRVHGLTEKEAFEIVQGVFDYYQDWESTIQADLKQLDFLAAMRHSWLIFDNPLTLVDANNKVLAMYKGENQDSIDPEWDYLEKYGYSSLNSIHMMRYHPISQHPHPGIITYQVQPNNFIKYGGATYVLEFDKVSCGQFIVLEKNRKLNTGDFQIMTKIAEYLEPLLGAALRSDVSGYSIFHNMIFGGPFDQRELDVQMNYLGWTKEDLFQITLIQPVDPDHSRQIMDLTMHTIQNQTDKLSILRKGQDILLLSKDPLSENKSFLALFRSLNSRRYLRMGFSLAEHGIHRLSALLVQAQNALKYGILRSPDQSIFYFPDYATDFILDTPAFEDKLPACHPAIQLLWRKKLDEGDELYDTLKLYLDTERSLNKTAEALFTHRNTILYRIRKCQDYLHTDLGEFKNRFYIRISMHYIEANEYLGPHSHKTAR